MLEHSVKRESLAKRWLSMDFDFAEKQTAEMQRELSLASARGDAERLESLKTEFLTSVYPRILAVRTVSGGSQNSAGKKIEDWNVTKDLERWSTPEDCMIATLILDPMHYESEPYVTFYQTDYGTDRRREIAVASLYDRAIHNIYAMMTEPILEPLYDLRLFSSRRGRSLLDATAEAAGMFHGDTEWVVKVDVKSFYDTIPHDWLLENFPMEKHVLYGFLKAPYVYPKTGETRVREKGIPAGNQISPMLANFILNGVEKLFDSVTVRWVDDIIIGARTKEEAEEFMARIVRFLAERGMEPNTVKSRIVHVSEGFEFVKYVFRKEGGSMIIRPTEDANAKFIAEISRVMSEAKDPKSMVTAVNNRIRGYVGKYRICDLAELGKEFDRRIYDMACLRAMEMKAIDIDQVRKRYGSRDEHGMAFRVDDHCIMRLSEFVSADSPRLLLTANPFVDTEYFRERAEALTETRVATVENRRVWSSTEGCCALCERAIGRGEDFLMTTDGRLRKGYVHRDCLKAAGTVVFSSKWDSAYRKTVAKTGREQKRKTAKKSPDPHQTSLDFLNILPEEAKPPAPKPSAPKPYQPVKTAEVIPRGQSKYHGMREHLSRTSTMTEMRFSEVEAIVGKLPQKAYTDAYWWHRKDGAITKELAEIGWRADKIDFGGRTVVFRMSQHKITPAERAYSMRRDPVLRREEINMRNMRIAGSRYGKLTQELLSSGMDQIVFDFDTIEKIIGHELPEQSLRVRRWWSNRRPYSILNCIEDGDFTKTGLDLENRTLTVTKTCCIPEPERGNVIAGELKIKPYMQNAVNAEIARKQAMARRRMANNSYRKGDEES